MKRQFPSIPATTNVGFAKRLVLDSPPVAPGVGKLLWRIRSRYHNILNPRARDPRRNRTRGIGRRSGSVGGQSAKIDNRNIGSRSSLLVLAFSAADRRVSPLVLVTSVTGSTATAVAAAGSRAPLGDPVLLFELF